MYGAALGEGGDLQGESQGALQGDSQSNPQPVAIALGSNLGDSAAILSGAIAALRTTPGIVVTAVSQVYRTAPIGPPQPDYLNACALLLTPRSPQDLLAQLLRIELEFGRERRERWGPRTLDLDLLLYGDRGLSTPTLQIPHPYLAERAFVLVPLAEIAPDWVHPDLGEAIATLAQRLDPSGLQAIGTLVTL